MASVGKTGSIPVAKHPATSVLPNSTRNVLCTVLADIKWTLLRGGKGKRIVSAMVIIAKRLSRKRTEAKIF